MLSKTGSSGETRFNGLNPLEKEGFYTKAWELWPKRTARMLSKKIRFGQECPRLLNGPLRTRRERPWW